MNRNGYTTAYDRQGPVPLQCNNDPIRLPADKVLRFENTIRRVPILCKDGTLWVTQENDPIDHILSPGDVFLPAPVGKVVLWAITDAMISRGE